MPGDNMRRKNPKNYLVSDDGRSLAEITDVKELQQLVIQQMDLIEKLQRGIDKMANEVHEFPGW